MLVASHAGWATDKASPFQSPDNHVKEELHTKVFIIRYADAKKIVEFIHEGSKNLLSKNGSAVADSRSNKIWVCDTSSHMAFIQHLIKKFDVSVPQVLIKAKIVSIDDGYVHSLGVIFKTRTGGSSDGNLSRDLPSMSSGDGVINIPVVKFDSDNILDLQINALEDKGHASIIASPELLTSNRKTADIETGEEVPYQEKTGEGNTSVTFKKAVLRLRVTPVILPGRRVLLKLSINHDKPSALLVNGVPAIQTQQLTTEVLLSDKQTVVLGGIFEKESSEQKEGVPGLRSIPLLGALFRSSRTVLKKKQLLIFVTPQVLVG